MKKVEVLVVIVNYCTSDHVCKSIECLAREKNSDLDIHVRVVDNNSPDGSLGALLHYVHERKLDWVEIVPSKVNGGYSAGNNLGLESIFSGTFLADYVWFLNPDTMPRSHSAAALVEFLMQRPRCIVGSRLEDNDGTLQNSHFNFPGIASEFLGTVNLDVLNRIFENRRVVRAASEAPVPTDWLAGASFMMRRDTLLELGPMDEGYFLYFEEVDYMLVAKKKGIQCWYVPSSRVIHFVGASTGISDSRQKPKRRPQYWFDSRRRFYIKNYGPAGLIGADLSHIIGYCFWCVKTVLFRPSSFQRRIPFYLRDFLSNSFVSRGYRL